MDRHRARRTAFPDEANDWPVFSDLAFSVVLLLFLLLALQTLVYGGLFVRRQLFNAQEAARLDIERVIGGEFAYRVSLDGDRQTLVFADPAVLFGSGSDALDPRGVVLFTRLGEVLARHQARIETVEVVGHADTVPILTRRFPSNWALSSARAAAVVHVFSERSRLEPAKMSAVGRADTRRARAEAPGLVSDRRVEIVVQYSEELLRSEQTGGVHPTNGADRHRPDGTGIRTRAETKS